MKTTKLLSLLLLCTFVVTFVTPALVQAQEGYSHQEYLEVVDLFFSVE